MKEDKATFIPSENPATKQLSNLTEQSMYFVAYAIYNRQKSIGANGPKGLTRPKIISVSETWNTYEHFYSPWTGILVYETVKTCSMMPKASYTAEWRAAPLQPFESRPDRTRQAFASFTAPDMLAPVIILRECEERESFLCNEKKCNGAALAQTNRSKVWGVNRWLGSLSSDVFERRTSTGNWLFAHLSRDFEQIFGQIVSVRIKTLGNTNTVASRLTKRENGSLPVDVRRSKTSLLKLPTATSPLRATEQKINWLAVTKYIMHALTKPLCVPHAAISKQVCDC